MHIGLVQVAIKPLLKTGVNAPIYLALHDKRLRHYKSSLLAVIQTSVCKGPIFFNCYPNFMVDLTCPMTAEALSLNVQTTLSRIWHLVKGGSVPAIHPPAEDLKFLLEGAPILATPFHKGREGDSTVTCEDLKKVHQQLNYTNTTITTIATQLNHVAIRVEETKKQEQVPSNAPEGSNYANSISKPSFKIESVPPKDQESFTHAFSNTSLLNQILTQIKALDLQTKSTSCLDKTCVLAKAETSTSEEEEEDDLGDSEEASLNVISKLFEEDSPLAINKICHWNSNTTRNLYPKPTL